MCDQALFKEGGEVLSENLNLQLESWDKWLLRGVITQIYVIKNAVLFLVVVSTQIVDFKVSAQK